MYFSVTLAVTLIFVCIDHTQCRKQLEMESAVRNEMLKNYDPSVRPYGFNGSGPVLVEVTTFIRGLKNIDEVNGVYNVELTLKQTWKDDRLKYDSKDLNYVTLTRPEKIWVPDLFFTNADIGNFHHIITPNSLIKINSDGQVQYSARISLRLSCPMNLQNYPLDNQTCSIVCASYGHITEDLIFIWKKVDRVMIVKNLHLPNFILNTFITDYCTGRTSTGEYSCLRIDFSFSRHTFYYIGSVYMPTAALVLLSWIVFWFNPRCSKIRLGIWIAVLISIIIVTTAISSQSPRVFYTTALDVWMRVCVFFIFTVLIELCLVNNALTADVNLIALQHQANGDTTAEKGSKMENHSNITAARSYSSIPLRWLNKYETKSQRIDVISRILFPFAFVFFNFVYWITYISRVNSDK